MPPDGSVQLTKRERDMLLAWSSDNPYTPGNEVLRIPLVNAQAWDTQSKNRDVFLDRRPAAVDCELGTGWLIEDDVLEIRSDACNYASLSQDSLLDLEVGTTLELNLSHSALTASEPATAFLALSIGMTSVWETEIAIPSESGVIKATIVLPVAVQRGDAIAFTMQNHGSNTYTFHSLNALINSDQQLELLPYLRQHLGRDLQRDTGIVRQLGVSQLGGRGRRPRPYKRQRICQPTGRAIAGLVALSCEP